MFRLFIFITGFLSGVFLTFVLGGHNALTRGQVEMYTFQTLQDDMSLDNDTKWLVFLHRRASWRMCDLSEQYKEVDGVPRCVRTPVEFEPITKE